MVPLLLLTASCGSNGGDNSVLAGAGAGGGTVAGVAASGSELIGYAFLKDSAGAALGPQVIGPDGEFSFDVSGLIPPFYLRADGNAGGRAVKFYSFAAGPGTTHINPLTNIALASAAGANNPGAIYADPSFYIITQASLDIATDNLRSMLMPLLVFYDGNINPFTGAYTANHSGLDGLLDVVSVDLNTTAGTVTIANRATGAVIGSALVTNLANPTNTIFTGEVPSPALLGDILEIKVMLKSFSSALNKGVNLTASDIEPFYAASYGINDGADRTLTINKEVSTPVTESKTITSIVGLNISPAGGGYRVTGAFLFSDGSLYFPDEGYIVTKEGVDWKLKGNGFKSEPDIVSASYRWKNIDLSTQTESGLRLRIKHYGGYGVKTAVITGPGLPVGGITLTDVCGPAVLCIEATARNNTGPTDADTFYLLSGSAIDAMPDNAEYTVNIYDAAPSLIETRTIRLQKAPFKRSELSLEGYFPKRWDAATHDIAEANIGGAPFAFSYMLPAAYRVAWFGAGLNFWDGTGNSASYRKNNLSFTAGTADIISAAPAWTPTGAALRLHAKGIFRRETVLVWMFQ